MVYNTLSFKAVLLVTVQIAVICALPLEEFFAYRLSSNKQLIANDDGSSLPIVLNPPLRFYGRSYNECQVGYLFTHGRFAIIRLTIAVLKDLILVCIPRVTRK